MKTRKELLGILAAFAAAMVFAVPVSAGKGLLKLNSQLQAGPWVSKSGIQIAPIYVVAALAPANYLSLDEATKSGVIEVSETDEVNELLFVNNSRRPILLLAGEIVSGGKQDRMVGRDVILAPGKSRKLNVFCVEHGRWSPRAGGMEFKSSSFMADKELRQKAQVRGGRAENQSGVWAEVAKAIDDFKVAAPTSNYHEIRKSDKFKDSEAIVRHFLKAIEDDDQVAGLVLAYNGEVQSVEYFASPGLFAKYREKLLRSYVTSALKNMEGSSPVDLEELGDFMARVLSKETHQYTTDSETVVESRSGRLESYELLNSKLKTVHYVRYVGSNTAPDIFYRE